MSFSSFSRAFGELARDERGIALPVAMLAIIASMGLAGAAVLSSVNVQEGSKHDSGSKSAIAAADAGVSAATTAVGQLLAEPGEPSCPGGATPSGGWCPPPAQPQTVGAATYSYRLSDLNQPCGDYAFCVVAEGMANGVARRVLVGFENMNPFEDEPGGGTEDGGDAGGIEGLIGEEEVKLDGSAIVRVNIGTNGNLVTKGSAIVCGDVRHGVGKEWIKEGSTLPCSGTVVTEANTKLPPVESFMPADIATNNSNYRLEKCTSTKPTKTPPGCQSDTFSGAWSGSRPWDPDTRTISTSGATTLTLGGGDYWLCRLSMSGANQLIMAEGAQVRLFFDTPENCGLSPTTEQIAMSGANRISATGYQPGSNRFEMPGFYLLGSETSATSLNLTGATGTNEFVLYAPRTAINLTGAVLFKGVIAGRRVGVTGSALLKHDDGLELPPELLPGGEDEDVDGGASGPVLYEPAYYVECAGPGSAIDPDANC